ncbi:uncharacterized protein LOC34621629 [Cyclospora cayetanensis]|uniref:Uncharacterized protein LOC34621629 n=1 Tax=Cyclospora cayetanensis TaxID=88456 RepID=A0A6P6RWN7_9EIME|nr:uncharacterized protein LOC34621629 [Cyclospora cayetanensis]
MGIRLLLQPLLTILVLLPILSPGLFSGRWYTCFFDSNKFSQGNGYVFSRLLVIASAIQLVFPLFDQSLHMLVTPNASSVASVLTPRPAGPIQVALLQMTVFLAMRDPTFVTACIACFVAVILSFAFLFLPEQRDAGLLVTAVTSFMFVAFTSRAFYTRTLEVNRRRLFCKYVLPYIMYLEEVALVLYAGSRGDEGDSDSSGSFASVGGLLQQPSSHPSLRLNPNATKSFGAWKAPSPYGGAPRRGTHGDRKEGVSINSDVRALHKERDLGPPCLPATANCFGKRPLLQMTRHRFDGFLAVAYFEDLDRYTVQGPIACAHTLQCSNEIRLLAAVSRCVAAGCNVPSVMSVRALFSPQIQDKNLITAFGGPSKEPSSLGVLTP